MKLSRPGFFYILSLLLLGVLAVLVFFRPLAIGREYSAVQKEQLLKTKDGLIIQFDLVNQEEKDTRYRLNFVVDGGTPYEEFVLLPAGGVYTCTHHVEAKRVTAGRVEMTIYRDREAAPLEKATYYLK